MTDGKIEFNIRPQTLWIRQKVCIVEICLTLPAMKQHDVFKHQIHNTSLIIHHYGLFFTSEYTRCCKFFAFFNIGSFYNFIWHWSAFDNFQRDAGSHILLISKCLLIASTSLSIPRELKYHGSGQNLQQQYIIIHAGKHINLTCDITSDV